MPQLIIIVLLLLSSPLHAESFFLVCDGFHNEFTQTKSIKKEKSLGIKVTDGELIYNNENFSFIKYQYKKTDYEITFSKTSEWDGQTDVYVTGTIDRISGNIDITTLYYLSNSKTEFNGQCKTTDKKAF